MAPLEEGGRKGREWRRGVSEYIRAFPLSLALMQGPALELGILLKA